LTSVISSCTFGDRELLLRNVTDGRAKEKKRKQLNHVKDREYKVDARDFLASNTMFSIPAKLSAYFASRTTPSNSLDAIYSKVRSKCFLGVSVVEFSLFARLEWISSIRPLRYFTVTASFCLSK